MTLSELSRPPAPQPDEAEVLFGPTPWRAAMPAEAHTSRPLAPIPTVPAPALDADAQRDLENSEQRLGDALPETGWLPEFIKLVVPMTSAPTEFHLTAGLHALSAVLGNRIQTFKWGRSYYPGGVWTLVVAPSSRWRKTTSMEYADDLLADSGLDLKLPDDFSRESLLAAVAKKPAGLLTIDEFAALLQTGRKDYGQGILADLTRIWDGKRKWVKELRKESFTIRRPAVNIYAATTIDWLQELVSHADLRSGFYGRFLFMGAAEPNTNRLSATHFDTNLRNRLIAGLHRLSEVAPALDPTQDDQQAVEAVLTPEADAVWKAWSLDLEARGESDAHPSYLRGLLDRHQVYGLKLAMVYRASACAFDRSLDPLTIDEAAMKAAIAYCELAWKHTVQLFEEDWAGTKEARILQDIEDKVPVPYGVPQTELMRKMRMKARELHDYLNTHIESEVLEIQDRFMGSGERRKATKWIVPGPNHKTLRRAVGQIASGGNPAEVIRVLRRDPISASDEQAA